MRATSWPASTEPSGFWRLSSMRRTASAGTRAPAATPAAALSATGEVFCWGEALSGQLGTGASNSGGAARSAARGAAVSYTPLTLPPQAEV